MTDIMQRFVDIVKEFPTIAKQIGGSKPACKNCRFARIFRDSTWCIYGREQEWNTLKGDELAVQITQKNLDDHCENWQANPMFFAG